MKKKTDFELIAEEFSSAVAEVQRARVNFDNAVPEFFEIANSELSIAIAKLNVVQKKIKMIYGEFV